MLFRRIYLFTFFLVLVVFSEIVASQDSGEIPGFLSAQEREWLEKNSVVNFTGDPNWLPYEAFQEDGTYVGIVADHLQLIEQKTGLKFKTIPVENWTESLQIATEGKVSIISGDAADAILNKRFNPVTPYSKNPIVIVMDYDQRYVDDLNEINDKKIAIIKGYGYTADIFSIYPEIKFIEVENIQEGLNGVADGKFDAMLATMALASYHMAEMGLHNIRVVGKTPIVMDLTLFVSKDMPILHSIIDKALRSISRSESLDIFQSWIRSKYVEKFDYQLFFKVIVVACLIVTLVLLWNKRLHQEVLARQESERQLKNIFELHSSLHVIVEIDGTIKSANIGWKDHLGYEKSELLGTKVFDLIHPDDIEATKQEMGKLSEGIKTFRFRNRYLDKNNEYRLLEWSAVYSDEDNLIYATANDITDKEANLQRLEELVKIRTQDLEKAKSSAEKANEEKSRFLANMSHELRTPMHAIMNFSSLGINRSENEKIRHYLENIHTSGERLTNLLNDLLDLSKLESGKMVAEYAKNDLSDIANTALSELSSLIQKKNIQIIFDNDENINGYFDSKLIIQVVINLLSNAIKFSPENSSIEISVSKTTGLLNGGEEILKLSVVDRGIGIPEDEKKVIFDSFVQSSKTRSDGGGTGLGLPISKEIIELHNGRIWAESPPAGENSGTEFIFEIPAYQRSV